VPYICIRRAGFSRRRGQPARVPGAWRIASLLLGGSWVTKMSEQRRAITLAEFQQLIRDMYLRKDVARGVDGTFMWLVEEVGELASALRQGTHEEQLEEFADVLAWLTTIANVVDVDLSEAVRRKYGEGCPGCGHFVCRCSDAGKP